MNLHPANATVASLLSQEAWRPDPRASAREQAAEAGRQFEALLLRKVLAEAYKPVFQSPYNPSSFSASLYQDMFTSQLADSLSRTDCLGLAKYLEQQLGGANGAMSHLPPAGLMPGQEPPLPAPKQELTSLRRGLRSEIHE